MIAQSGVITESRVSTFTLATAPSAALNSGARIFISDAGRYGHYFRSDGTFWQPVGEYLLASDNVAGSAHTGTTDETLLASVTIPASALRTNGELAYDVLWTMTNGADDKTLRVRLGTAAGVAGTAFTARVVTTNAGGRLSGRIKWRNSQSAQVGQPAGISGVSESTGSVVTGTLDGSAALVLSITGQLENAANSMTIQAYSVSVR